MVKKALFMAALMVCFLTITGHAVKNMAILEFKTTDVPEADVSLVRNTLKNVLVKATDIPIVEREKTKKILKEQEFQSSGATDVDQAVRLGRILNVHYLMTGEISKSGGKQYLTLRAISVENARVLASQQLSGKTIQDLLREIEEKVPDYFNGLATLETYHPKLDSKDKGMEVRVGSINDHPLFDITISRISSGAGIYFNVSKIDITYFSKIRITFDSSVQGNIEMGLYDVKEKESKYVALDRNHKTAAGTYEIPIADFKIKYDVEWVGISLIFTEKMKDTRVVIRELVVLP